MILHNEIPTRCCGMSLTLNNTSKLKGFLFKNITISGIPFYTFLFTLSCISFIIPVFKQKYLMKIKKYKKRKEIIYQIVLYLYIFTIKSFIFLVSWMLMMVSMTANVKIIFFILVGHVFGSIWCVRNRKYRNGKIRNNFYKDIESSTCCM
ncbi:hypothetical protein CWI36_0469p0020 [Hamiltosporidium magnivora]|uniref:Copper transporter n=1 Tax=Hamiltosporidium magnivora TaxID=148818 RepID=A0A4Q9LFT2_9MICR|nr:hypothetical protein CWI36_0469p0020 [Hamiltosporidium magnivora]